MYFYHASNITLLQKMKKKLGIVIKIKVLNLLENSFDNYMLETWQII